MIDYERIPAHVAIIMDGNGRWAEKRKLPRVMGHNAGMKAMKEIVRHAGEIGVEYLTVYAFSTENWKRSEEEVSGIFNLLIKYVDSELKELCDSNVKVSILGDWSGLSDKVKEKLQMTLDSTKNNTGLKFNIALNYGSRDEMARAAKSIAEDAALGKITADDVDEKLFSKKLYTGQQEIPDPDLVIRTSGEIRLSNFLLWQLAYAEMVFTDTLWPDYTPEEFEKSIEIFQSRDRRFGGRK